MSRNAVGRAFRITEKDARSYDRTSRPRPMRPNPMGVTALATVNGRGASARAGAQGQTREQRLARARKLLGGKGMQSNARGHRAAFISAMRSNKTKAKTKPVDQRRRGKRLAAYKGALKRNKSKASAARAALRAVPFTSNERKRKTSFAGVKARYRGNRDTVAEQKRYEAGWDETFKKKGAEAKKTKRAAKTSGKKGRKTTKGKGTKVAKARKTKRKSTRETTGRVSPAVGQSGAKRRKGKSRRTYQRAKLYNPRTGRTEYSYMYRAAGGRLRRIPTSAIIGGGKGLKGFNPKLADKVRKARESAAARILKHGDAFVPNKKRKTKRKSAKRVAAGKKAARTRKRRAASAGTTRKRRKTKRKSTRKATRGRKRKSTRKSAKRVAAGKKAARTRKRRKSTRKSGGSKRKAKRKSGKRRGKARRLTKGAYYVTNRRRSRSKRRGGKRMRKNAFMANLKNVLKTGALVAVGYMSHRVLSSLLDQYVFTPYVQAPEGKEPNMTLKPWNKPICGAVVGLVGVGALSMMTDKNMLKGETAMAIGGGMIASLVQYVVVGALSAFDQPVAAGYLNGYSNSMAYSLRGNRRHRRGVGAMQSIMPRYQPISGLGAAGYMQAAAGMGEYFTGTGTFEQAAAGVGEYFVPQGTQGVGQYEPAGPLAMQAAAGFGQIEDGIRPDSNLDRVLDLAESAAGLGEYITATPAGAGWDESRVPTQSQWIPNGPLWAGTLGVKDTMATSELPAGVLATVGGNGILSG